MTAPHIIDPASLVRELLSQASPDMMRDLLQMIINALLSADAGPSVRRPLGPAQPPPAAYLAQW